MAEKNKPAEKELELDKKDEKEVEKRAEDLEEAA